MQSMLEKTQQTTVSGFYYKKQITYLQCMKECLNEIDCKKEKTVSMYRVS